MKRSNIVLAAGGLLLAAAATWYFASPIWTLKQMRDAAAAKDSDALSAYVDFPALREDLKADLSVHMMKEAQKEGNGMGRFGAVMAMAFAEKMIDGMVSPAGVQMMFTAQDKEALKGPHLPVRADTKDIKIERLGFSKFRVKSADAKQEGGMVFERSGFGWKLTGIDLPENAEQPAS